MIVVNHANLSSERLAEIKGELSKHCNLSDVLRWAFAQPAGVFISSVVANVVVQDEFTHDVVIPWGNDLVLVYDTT